MRNFHIFLEVSKKKPIFALYNNNVHEQKLSNVTKS